MDTPELAQQSVNNLAGLLILTAIPVVSFALWADYFERYIAQIIEKKDKLEASAELGRIRGAGLWVSLCQMMVFFGSTPVRREYPAFAYPLFLAAVLIQLGLQRSLEVKISNHAHALPGAGKFSQPEGNILFDAIRTMIWSLGAGALYVASIAAAVLIFAGVGAVLHASDPVKIALILFGMGLGVLAGLGLNFALGAFFIRKIMRASKIEEGRLQENLQELFSKNTTQTPGLWSIKTPNFQIGSAMVAGFPEGSGIFKPGLFLSDVMIKNLTDDETSAVVLHEISHIKLSHLKKRFYFSCGLILCGSLITGIFILLARGLGLPQSVQSTLGIVSLFTSFVCALLMLARQVKYQEITADIHCVEKLGANLEALSSALRKLDKLAGNIPQPHDGGSLIMALGHPSTEFRIRILERYFARKAKDAAAAEIGKSDTDSGQKAA